MTGNGSNPGAVNAGAQVGGRREINASTATPAAGRRPLRGEVLERRARLFEAYAATLPDFLGGRHGKPATTSGVLRNLPSALEPLKLNRHWVLWRWQWNSTRRTKVPFQPSGGRASVTDPGTWNTYEAVAAELDRFDGIGYVLTHADVAAFDLDDCHDLATGWIHPWAMTKIEEADSYVEVTPSGAGLRIIGKASGPQVHTKKQLDGMSCEIYRRAARYITISGNQISTGNTLAEIDEVIDATVAEFNSGSQGVGDADRPNEDSIQLSDELPQVDICVLPSTVRNALYRCGAMTDASRRLVLVAGAMAREGFADDLIAAVLMNRQEAVSEHVYAKHATEPERRRAVRRAIAAGRRDPHGVRMEDFRAYMPAHAFIFMPSRELWPASSVDARLPSVPLFDRNGSPLLDKNGNPKMIRASTWLAQNSPVEQMTWAPGEPPLVPDRLISDGGWIDRAGMNVFNQYRPPMVTLGNAAEARPWVDHVLKVYGEDADHIIRWLAQRVQRPQDKINHALVLGGSQGIGKDTALEPVKQAVGPWNFIEASPQQVLGQFNGFVKSVILRISEARDLGDINRFQFYEHLKAYEAAPPDVLRVDEKNLREHSVINCCGVIITTNRKDSLYLPEDDRRHYVAWSDLTREAFTEAYWRTLWRWYRDGGDRHVAAYLAELDLSQFDAKAPPPKTAAFWQIIENNRAPEDSELADVLDRMANPPAVTIKMIASASQAQSSNFPTDFYDWFTDRRNRRAIPHRMEQRGYVQVRSDAKDGFWVIGGERQVVYARAELSVRDRFAAANALRNAQRGDGGHTAGASGP